MSAPLSSGSTQGLPPRGRGNPPEVPMPAQRLGSTPAWAGKPISTLVIPSASKVYPRVGGETTGISPLVAGFGGLPPRGRGNQRRRGGELVYSRSTPAWAGKPIRQVWQHHGMGVYPRVGGETNPKSRPIRLLPGLPPRGRGNRPTRLPPLRRLGSTPAWAGKPSQVSRLLGANRVYPRVGGETC